MLENDSVVEASEFIQRYIIPTDSAFNQSSKDAFIARRAREVIKHHNELEQYFHEAPKKLVLSPIEMEARKIMFGDQRADVSTDSFAQLAMEHAQKVRASKSLDFEKSAKFAGKGQESPGDRFRNAVKSICKALRRAKVDGRIGMRNGTKKNDGSETEQYLSNIPLLTLEALEIWYKPSKERIPAELDYLERGVSLLRSFSKYSRSVRRELCRVAVYEMFQQGRTLIRQGHEAWSMYFVLSGTVDVVKSETDLKTGKIYTQTVASLHGGDSFGELALLNRSLRTASAFCKTECRLLRVDRDDFEHVIKMAAEQELIGKYDFLRTCPTFQSMVHLPELKKIAELSHLKEYQQNALVLGDCENSEELYFIRKGSCRAIQVNEFVQTKMPNGHIQVKSFKDGMLLKPNEKHISKLLVLDELNRLRHFGGLSLIRSTTKRQAMTEVFVKTKTDQNTAVVSNTKTECLIIKKVDFLRFATDQVYEQIRTEVLDKRVTATDAVKGFLRIRKWEDLKREVVKDLLKYGSSTQ